MLCPGSLKWSVFGLFVVFGCGGPDTVGTGEESSSSGEPAGSTAEIATSTDPGPATTTGDSPGTTSAGTGSASGTTTEAPTGTDSSGGSTGTASEDTSTGTSGETGAMLCRPGAEGDACSECVAEQCNAGFCECAELGECLCVLGCLDSDSLGALLGCVLGECGLVDVSLDNLTAVVTGALTPLDDCTALVGEEPADCSGVCPGLAYLP